MQGRRSAQLDAPVHVGSASTHGRIGKLRRDRKMIASCISSFAPLWELAAVCCFVSPIHHRLRS
jgi:hypothetical protein